MHLKAKNNIDFNKQIGEMNEFLKKYQEDCGNKLKRGREK